VGQAETEDQRLNHDDVQWWFGHSVRETERRPTKVRKGAVAHMDMTLFIATQRNEERKGPICQLRVAVG
jgi:hypothetical protein